MLIRHATDGNLYLYDMVNIKKKRAPRLSNSCMQMVVKELQHHCFLNF